MGLPFRIAPPPGLLILGMAASALVGIIGFELREGTREEARAPAPPIREQLEPPPVSSSGNMPDTHLAQHVAAILARRLFSPNRRPYKSAATKAIDLARLSGVLVSPTGKSAIFASSASGKPIVVSEGGRIGEYIISAIDIGAVTVIGPGGVRVLHPAFDPSPPPPKPPTPNPIVKSTRAQWPPR